MICTTSLSWPWESKRPKCGIARVSGVEAEITGPFDTAAEYVAVSSFPSGLAAGDPYGIGREGDIDVVRIEEMAIDKDQRVHLTAFNYDESVYYHEDYGGGEVMI